MLDRILTSKLNELESARRAVPLAQVRDAALTAPPPRDFKAALSIKPQGAPLACIAEIKRASPSKGIIRHDFDPVQIARSYADCGASAISVLTDGPFFGGDLNHLRLVRQAVHLPVLRKDFILDDYQVYQARAFGADAVLLIVAAMSDAGRLRALRELAEALGMAALVEVHTRDELELAVQAGADLVGINLRDLRSFRTSIDVFLELALSIPPNALVVAESGISTSEQCRFLAEAGAHAVLVGEALMRQPDPGLALRALLGLDSSAVGQDMRHHHLG